jgi:hypothetical protein
VTRQSEVAQPTSDRPRANPQPGKPITLGIDLPPTRPSVVPLWAGPIRVESGSWSKDASPSDSRRGPFADMASLLSEILESWRRY